jgi:hypothetical protein
MLWTVRFARPAALAGLIAIAIASGGCASVYHTEISDGFSAKPLTPAGGLPLQVNGVVGGQRGAPLAQAVADAMPASVGGVAVQ